MFPKTAGILIASASITGVAFVSACSGGSDGTTVVQQPGLFRLEVPDSWQVFIPRPADDERLPLMSAGDSDNEPDLMFLTLLDDSANLDTEAKGYVESIAVEMGELKSSSRRGFNIRQSTGSGRPPWMTADLEIVVAIYQEASPDAPIFAVACQSDDLGDSDCDEVLESVVPNPIGAQQP